MMNKKEWEMIETIIKTADDVCVEYSKKIDKLEDRIKELEEINKEEQKLNGELQKKLTYYENICKGKSIQELGMSDLYKED